MDLLFWGFITVIIGGIVIVVGVIRYNREEGE